jgi:hypothetical protein
MGVDKKFDNRWRIFYPSALEKKVWLFLSS